MSWGVWEAGWVAEEGWGEWGVRRAHEKFREMWVDELPEDHLWK